MDAITPTSEEEKITVDDWHEEMTEDFRGEKKQKLDMEKDSSEESHIEPSSLLDERRDEDVVARRRLEDEEKNELRNIEDEVPELKMVKKDDGVERSIIEDEEWNKRMDIYYRELELEEMEWEEGLSYVEEEALRFLEYHDKKKMKRGKGLNTQKQGRIKKAPVQDLRSPGLDVPLIGTKKRDQQVGEEKKARDSSDTARLLGQVLMFKETKPVEIDEDMEESDEENGVKLMYRSLKECWDDSSDDENISPESQIAKLTQTMMPKKLILSEELKATGPVRRTVPQEEALSKAVFPCICEALTSGRKSFEVLVEKGYLRVGTPLLSMNRKNLELGVIKSISVADESSVDIAKAGDKVKIQVRSAKGQVIAKEHLMSRFDRKSYELFKYYKKDFSKEDWELMMELLSC